MVALGVALTWAVSAACHILGSNRSTGAMMLLLAVLGVSALGDGVLAIATSISASLAFSWYFVDATGRFEITTVQGGITFASMVVTAITASRLSIRAQRRTDEAIRRREEMSRLNELGSSLLSVQSVREAAEVAVNRMVQVFELHGAVMRIEGEAQIFERGSTSSDQVSVITLAGGGRGDLLELYGPQPSGEVCSAVSNMLSLVLERARSSQAKAKMESTQKGEELRSTVLNALAHNFRTPLTSIKAAASMLRGSETITAAGERDLIAAIDEEADRLDQLIGESLDLAKIEGRRANPRTEICHFADIVRKVTGRVERYLGGREFIIDVPEDLPAIRGDRFLLEQMLIQVVDNAWKYSGPGARIRVIAEVQRKNIILTVQNEGNQIPESERSLIFDKFYRGGNDRSRVEGTGLGLAIARTIVETYQGSVWLDSEPQGPAFRFALPLEAAGKKGDNEPYYSVDRR
jgi:two-component system, OmpR family, sensor histidine kinase KdpD